VTLEQTPRELNVLLSMMSHLGELPCNGVSFQLTGYAESNEKKIYLLFHASDKRQKQIL